ncbi:hypothetical protein EV426DRAFT_706414 [Tirmania nivea]|nr:hypothetical protein EV426DRAFT_706414 [Tirmania nivea]
MSFFCSLCLANGNLRWHDKRFRQKQQRYTGPQLGRRPIAHPHGLDYKQASTSEPRAGGPPRSGIERELKDTSPGAPQATQAWQSAGSGATSRFRERRRQTKRRRTSPRWGASRREPTDSHGNRDQGSCQSQKEGPTNGTGIWHQQSTMAQACPLSVDVYGHFRRPLPEDDLEDHTATEIADPDSKPKPGKHECVTCKDGNPGKKFYPWPIRKDDPEPPRNPNPGWRESLTTFGLGYQIQGPCLYDPAAHNYDACKIERPDPLIYALTPTMIHMDTLDAPYPEIGLADLPTLRPPNGRTDTMSPSYALATRNNAAKWEELDYPKWNKEEPEEREWDTVGAYFTYLYYPLAKR